MVGISGEIETCLSESLRNIEKMPNEFRDPFLNLTDSKWFSREKKGNIHIICKIINF